MNKADYAQILRIPGVGVKSAQRIIASRRYGRLTPEHLKKMGVAMNRAQFFITAQSGPAFTIQEAGPAYVRKVLSEKRKPKSLSYASFLSSRSGSQACRYFFTMATFEGLLSAVFDVYTYKIFPDRLLADGEIAPLHPQHPQCRHKS